MKSTTAPAATVFRAFGKYRVEYNPKVSPIGLEVGAAVTADLAAGLPEFNVTQYFGSQPTIFTDYDHVVTGRNEETGRAVGLLGARWLGNEEVRFLYLWTAMIADAYRHTMLFNRMVQFFFEQLSAGTCAEAFPELIVTKTYNPVVYSIFKSFAQPGTGIDVYPTIPARRQEPELIELAERVAKAISTTLVLRPQSGVVLGGQAMVAPDFFPRMEQSREADVNRHFEENLTRADQVLCILRIPPQARQAALRLVSGGRSNDVDQLAASAH